MATTRTVRPGEMVVPLQDIIDQLGDKLSRQEIEELVRKIVSGRRELVRPGDLITPDHMNYVLTRLEDLSTRLAMLETGTPGSRRGVVIREPNASTVLRVGERLAIRGDNLLPDSVVEIDGRSVAGFRGSTDNTTLALDSIPSTISVSGDGRDVELHVTNTAGSDAVTFRLRPRELTMPIGSLSVAQTGGPTPAPPSAGYKKGGKHTFVFTITADTRPDERFLLTPVMDNGWNAGVVGDSEILIQAARDSRTPTVVTASVAIQIPQAANTRDIGNLTLLVESKRNASLKARSQPVKIEVGGAVQPARTIAVSLANTAGDAAMRDNGDGTKTGFVTPGSTAGSEFELEVTVPRAGRYKVDTAKLAKFVGDQTPAKWSASLPGATNGEVTLTAPKDSVHVAVTAGTGARPATLVFEIVSVSNPADSGTLELSVEPLAII